MLEYNSCMNRRQLILITSTTLIVLALSACSPGAIEAPAPQPTAPLTQLIEGSEVPSGFVDITPVVATAQPTAVATQVPTQVPTEEAIVIRVTTQPIINDVRLIEMSWPSHIILGDSAEVRLTFNPSTGSVDVVVEDATAEGQIVEHIVSVRHLEGYQTRAAALLDGVGFAVSPAGEQSHIVTPGEPLVWRWTVAPQQRGQQHLGVTLMLRWTPVNDPARVARESVIYSKGLDIPVYLPARTGPEPLMIGGILFFALLAAGTLLLALRRRPRREAVGLSAQPIASAEPNPALSIELHPDIDLTSSERQVLKSLFKRYDRVVLEREFRSGYSGARALLVVPILADGRKDAHTIVKISSRGAISQEYQNYRHFVADSLPPITARIQRAPIASPKADLAALQYTFVGHAGSVPQSLRQRLLQQPDPALIDKLFDSFGANWWMQRTPYTFRLAQEYDRKLPTHYFVRPSENDGRLVDGRTAPGQINLEIGDVVSLQHFEAPVARVGGTSWSLKGPAVPGQPSLRIRWIGDAPPNGSGAQVIQTRNGFLADRTEGMDLGGLQNPIYKLEGVMRESLSGTRSTIHGDLNLENALLGQGDLVWLIDFAETRQGHAIYDFAHLYAEVVSHILAPSINDPRAFLEILDDDADPLLARVRSVARRCLFNPADPREFDLAVYLSGLGALKFDNLDRHARHLLFLTSAWIAQRL
jgi:hypothetical protein